MQLLRAGDYAGRKAACSFSWISIRTTRSRRTPPTGSPRRTTCARDYAAAAAAFARNYRLYGKDDTKAPDNLLKLGMSLQALQETDKACRTYAELAEEFPNAPAHIQQALARGTRARRVRLRRPGPLVGRGRVRRLIETLWAVRAAAAPGSRGLGRPGQPVPVPARGRLGGSATAPPAR